MKKQMIRWTVLSAVVMLGLPFVLVLFAGEAGMMLAFLLFFAVDPIYSVVIGWAAGKERKKLWALPVISSGLFLAGVWIFFTIREIWFVVYAIVYLTLGLGAMLAASFFAIEKS